MKKETKRKGVVALGALALLAAVGATAGNTYARYVASKTVASETATVAKWGFVIDGTAENLFSTMYDTTGAPVKADGNSVVVKSTDKVVAPGAHGSLKFTITGVAEVDAQIQVTVGNNFKDIALVPTTGNTYNPIKYYLSPVAGGAVTTTAVAGTSLKSSLEAWTAKVEAGTELKGTTAITYELKWEWEFSKDEATDALDTVLAEWSNGNKNTSAYKETETNVELALPDITVSIVQVR